MKRVVLSVVVIVFLATLVSPISAHDYRSERKAAKRQADSIKVIRADEEIKLNSMLRGYLEHQPSFGMYHDNYFITGIPTNRPIDKYSADAKFQISIRQVLLRNLLPKNNILAITYTQKSFWDIYRMSSPFADNNYNPGISASRPITRNGEFLGIASLGFEHESNGRDSIWSRSWNYVALSGSYFFTPNLSMQIKVMPGWTAAENRDLYNYRGWGLFALNYSAPNERFMMSAVVNPHGCFRAFNTQLELSVKLWKTANQFLFVQWHQGYGENLLEYNRYTSMVRVGICIKSKMRSFIPLY